MAHSRTPWATAADPYHPPGWWHDLGLVLDEFEDDDN